MRQLDINIYLLTIIDKINGISRFQLALFPIRGEFAKFDFISNCIS